MTFEPLPGTALTLLNGAGIFVKASGTPGASEGILPSALATGAGAVVPPAAPLVVAGLLADAAGLEATVAPAPVVGFAAVAAVVAAVVAVGAAAPPPHAASTAPLAAVAAPASASRSICRRLIANSCPVIPLIISLSIVSSTAHTVPVTAARRNTTKCPLVRAMVDRALGSVKRTHCLGLSLYVRVSGQGAESRRSCASTRAYQPSSLSLQAP